MPPKDFGNNNGLVMELLKRRRQLVIGNMNGYRVAEQHVARRQPAVEQLEDVFWIVTPGNGDGIGADIDADIHLGIEAARQAPDSAAVLYDPKAPELILKENWEALAFRPHFPSRRNVA
jgi:hypothetical protein